MKEYYSRGQFMSNFNVIGKSVPRKESFDKDMLSLITTQGYDVLIKDASYLGFPAYHVISPGFSEIHEVNLRKVREVCSSLITRKALRNLYNSSDDELREVISYLNCTECGAAYNCSYSIRRDIKRALKDRQAAARLKDLRELGI
jgi:hypothetical protein